MKSMTSEATITAFKGLFARYELPKVIVSDNDTNFALKAF